MKKFITTANSPISTLSRIHWHFHDRKVFLLWQMNQAKPILYLKTKRFGFGYLKSQCNSETNSNCTPSKILLYGSIVFGFLWVSGKCFKFQKIAHQQFKPVYQLIRSRQPTASEFLKIIKMSNAFLKYLHYYEPNTLYVQPDLLLAAHLEEPSILPKLPLTSFQELVLAKKSHGPSVSSHGHHSSHSKSKSGTSSTTVNSEHNSRYSGEQVIHNHQASSEHSEGTKSHANSISKIIETINTKVAETQDLFPNLPDTPAGAVPFNDESYWVTSVEYHTNRFNDNIPGYVVTGMYMKEEPVAQKKSKTKRNKTVNSDYNQVKPAKLNEMENKHKEYVDLGDKATALYELTGRKSKALYQSIEKVDQEAFRLGHLGSTMFDDWFLHKSMAKHIGQTVTSRTTFKRVINPLINPGEYNFWKDYYNKMIIQGPSKFKTPMALVSKPGNVITHSNKKWLVYDKTKTPEPYYLDIDYNPNNKVNLYLKGDKKKFDEILFGLTRRKWFVKENNKRESINRTLADIYGKNFDIVQEQPGRMPQNILESGKSLVDQYISAEINERSKKNELNERAQKNPQNNNEKSLPSNKKKSQNKPYQKYFKKKR